MRVRKSELSPPAGLAVHKSKALPDDLVRFSFRHLTSSEKFCLPGEGELVKYMGVLLSRLKAVSDLRLSEFRSAGGKALRAHRHDWSNTTEEDGYSHLSQQLQECEPWQFSLSANEYGRVHGILVDNVFYVVWFDPEHRLYEGH